MVKEGLSKEVTFKTDQKDKKAGGQSELSAALTELPADHLIASPTDITAHCKLSAKVGAESSVNDTPWTLGSDTGALWS